MNSLFGGFDLSVSAKPKKVDTDALLKKLTPSATAQKKLDTKITNQNLFADAGEDLADFHIELNKPKPETLAARAANPEDEEVDAVKVLKSKKLSLPEKLAIIKLKVLEVLGKQKKNVVVIKTKEEFEDYVSKAIQFGRIAIDTETNNSTDPMTCQLMGLCLYYEGGKQAYIPINHVNPNTGEHLDWQLTEADCREQLQRIKDAGTFIVMHNGKFDYEVIKCTCNIEIEPDWDTMIGAHTLNENELMGLKPQYISKIDPTQAKYDIESLFIVPYKYVDPDIFALYAATDSYMTDRLYLYQVAIFEQPGNERLYWMFKTIEMPVVKVTADIELIGVCIDQDFGEKLKVKYNQILEGIDEKIEIELKNLEPIINEWKSSKDATDKTRQFEPKKTKLSLAKLEEKYPFVDEKTGKRYKVGKAKIEQLGDPINLASPTQLAIVFYDILKCPVVSKKSPRGTGKDELEAIAEKTDITLCKLILERRGIVKLITTYIDVIPALAQHWPDGRVRYRLNPVGTDTGRFSSGGEFKFLDENENPVELASINSQNIPSRGDGKITRLLFEAKKSAKIYEADQNSTFTIPEITEVETPDGYKYCKDLNVGDFIITDDAPEALKSISYNPAARIYILGV